MPVLELEERAQPLAHDGVVVDDEHADRLSQRRPPAGRVVPAPGVERISSVPPSRCARSSIEVRPSRRERMPGVAGLEADAVVLDLEHEPPSAGVQPDRDVRRRPRGGARSASASWAIRSTSPSRAGSAGSSSSISSVDLALLEAAEHLDVLAQRAAEPVALEIGRPQLEDERAQLVERLLRERLQLRDLLARRAPGRARAACSAASALSTSAEQLLADGVVQVEREPVPLGHDRELAALARTGARS